MGGGKARPILSGSGRAKPMGHARPMDHASTGPYGPYWA